MSYTSVNFKDTEKPLKFKLTKSTGSRGYVTVFLEDNDETSREAAHFDVNLNKVDLNSLKTLVSELEKSRMV